MDVTNDKLKLYSESDRSKRTNEYEDCLVFADGMLETLLPQDEAEMACTADLSSLVNLGLIPIRKEPPSPDTDPHADPWVVFYRYTDAVIKPRDGMSGSPVFNRHAAVFDGYGPNPGKDDGYSPMVIAKDNYDGDVERHRVQDSDYGQDIYYISVKEAVNLRRDLARKGYKTLRDLWKRHLQIRSGISKPGMDPKTADTQAKQILLAELGYHELTPPEYPKDETGEY